MKSNLTTFQGSLGDLVHALREAASTKNRAEAIKIFPQTDQIKTLGGRVWETIPFFEKHLPELMREVYQPLYPTDSIEVEESKKALEQFYRSLGKIKQYYKLSRRKEGEKAIANENIAGAFNKLHSSHAKRFENWISGGQSPDIERIDDLIIRTKSWLGMLSGSKKRGRPSNRFNILVFHVVKRFTFRCFRWWWERKDGKYKIQRDYIMRDGKFRVRKNWQLICATLLWIHVHEGIPEMKTFIKEHEDDDAAAALRSLTVQIKKEYSNLRRTGKGSGKFAGAFPDGSQYLDVLRVYADDNGSFRGRLF
jgi:hypothetical protein